VTVEEIEDEYWTNMKNKSKSQTCNKEPEFNTDSKKTYTESTEAKGTPKSKSSTTDTKPKHPKLNMDEAFFASLDAHMAKLDCSVQWNLGDTTWEPYENCKDLEALQSYLDLAGITNWRRLPRAPKRSSKKSTHDRVKN
jgi:hypothetical protein